MHHASIPGKEDTIFEWISKRIKKRAVGDQNQRVASPSADPPFAESPFAANDLVDDKVAGIPRTGTASGKDLASMHAARDALWNSVGDVDPDVAAPLINPAFLGGPTWPGLRQSFRRIVRADGIGIVTSDGLADPDDEGMSATGLGSEVYLASAVFATTNIADLPTLWQFNTLYQVAQNIANMRFELGPELERYGALSMGIPQSMAPTDWLDEAGGIGVLLGVGLPGMPESISVPAGIVVIVGAVPLRPDELAYVLAKGATGRRHIAVALRSLAAEQLASPHRASVFGS